MLIIAGKIIVCLVVAAFLGGAIGFLIGRGIRKKSQQSLEVNPSYKAKGNVYNKPFILGKPRPSGKDNLHMIEGITSEIEHSLYSIGIFHYEQISKWSDKNCEWVDEYLSLEGGVSKQQWVSQAKDIIKHN